MAKMGNNQVLGAIPRNVSRAWEHRILDSEAKYRDLFEAAQDGIMSLDPQTETILEVNPYLARLLDYPQEYFAGKALWQIGLFPDVETSRKALQRIKSQRYCHYGVLPLDRKDGRVMWVELFCNVYGAGGKEVIQCHVRDTSMRNSEEGEHRLLQTQKMEAVGQLAAEMAHDFNNLLQVILAYSEILQARIDLPDPVRHMIGTIQEAGTSAKSLTHRLLAFSHQQVLNSKILDLNETVRRMQILLRGLIGDDIDLVNSLDQDLGTIEADPHQIEQVLMNLAINARDAMPKGGTISFETANILIDDSSVSQQTPVVTGRYVTLIVRGTGSKMDAKTRGTGLALSTVFSFVKQNRGVIAASSDPDHGTCFTLYFPRHDEAPLASETTTSELVRGGAETILLVDDAPSSRMLLRIVLQNHGYTVLDSGQPAEALRISREHRGPLPLMITDVSMPGLSGPELAEQLAVGRPETKVIYISGNREAAATRYGMEGTRYTFLEKPFTCEDLLIKVRRVLDLPMAPSA